MFDSLLDAIGYAGDALNKPGRAVRGLLSGKLDEGLAAVPFSDSLGLTDPSRQTSGRELLGSLGLDPGSGLGGDLAGFGAEVATDPLTFLGGAAGRALGGRASAAAAARGPRYETTADDLARIVAGGSEAAADHAAGIVASPNAARLLSELDPTSKLLGAGAEGLALMEPSGRVARIGREKLSALGRPIDERILPASSTTEVPFSGTAGHRVERSAYATNVDNPEFFTADRINALGDDLRTRGLDFFDRKAANVGTSPAGHPVVIDPGAVDAVPTSSGFLPAFAGDFSPVTRAAEPGAAMSALLDALGSDRAVRAAYAGGLAGPNFRTPLTIAGGGLGSVGGAFGRAVGGR